MYNVEFENKEGCKLNYKQDNLIGIFKMISIQLAFSFPQFDNVTKKITITYESD